MKPLAPIGQYLDRPVYLVRIESFDDSLSSPSLTHATILLVTTGSVVNGSDLDGFLRALSAHSPLVISLAGHGARKTFDHLLAFLSENPSSNHIMTSLFEKMTIAESVEDFLTATWPAEERFADWREYLILVLGDPSQKEVIKGIVEKLC